MLIRNKILLLITNLGPGGAQRVFYDHCRILSNFYEIEEVVFDAGEQLDLYGSVNTLHSLDVQAGTNLLAKLSNLFSRGSRLRRIAEQSGAALVISHMDGANWVNVLSKTRSRKILVVHGTVLRDERTPAWLQVLRRKFIFPVLYNRADVTVAVSEGIKAELEHCGVRNVRSIPNFFDLKKITTLAAIPLPPAYVSLFSNYPVLITSGRYTEQKKQAFLLKVFGRIIKLQPGLKLVLLGEGELEAQLVQEARGEGLSVYNVAEAKPFSEDADVFFLGYVTNPFSYLSRSQLFLFPSAWEGFPMALCEAMICGVPVLASDCPTGPRQILAPGTARPGYDLQSAEPAPYGELLPMVQQPGALDVWVNAVAAALANPNICQVRAAAARHRMKAFDKQMVMQQWFDLINSFLPKENVSLQFSDMPKSGGSS